MSFGQATRHWSHDLAARRVKRLGSAIAGVGMVAIVGILAIGGFASATDDSDEKARPADSSSAAAAGYVEGPITPGCPLGKAVDGLTGEQLTNATAIAQVAVQRGLGRPGAVLGIMTGDTESDLINVGHGDSMGPSSRGLFQQMGSWGPMEVRMNPAGSAGLFFDAVVKIPGWQQREPWNVAQQVQSSEFDGHHYRDGKLLGYGDNYKAKYDSATKWTNQLLSTCATPPPAAGSGGVAVSGVTVTLPTGANVDPLVAGKTIQAPTAAVARGLAAGFAAVGLPYVYGGGTSGGPADQGCSRAGGALNSCQGTVGFDCSGLTGYVLRQAGFQIPDNSGGQRGAGVGVPRAQGRPGDIIGYEGHVAVYLGVIGADEYLLEAPDVGMNVQIRKAYWSNHNTPADSNLHRYWS